MVVILLMEVTGLSAGTQCVFLWGLELKFCV